MTPLAFEISVRFVIAMIWLLVVIALGIGWLATRGWFSE